MQVRSRKATITLLFGLVGILAVIFTIICDFILIGKPNSTYSFLKLGTESMKGLSQWRIYIGTFLGIIVLPLQIAGLVPVYYGLKPGGKVKSIIVVLITGHAAIIAVAFHISYAFIASGWNLYNSTAVENLGASEMLKRFDLYWRITIIIMAVELLLSSILYVILILGKKTLYPKWMAFLSPICVLFYTFLLVLPIPHPLGGFLGPAFLNLSTLIFLTFSTIIVYKRLRISN
jgi:hypothetical protein